MRDRFIMAQTVHNLAVLTDFVTLEWHDLARHIAGHCWNKIRVSVRLALDFSELESYSSSRYMTSVRRSTRKTRVQICECTSKLQVKCNTQKQTLLISFRYASTDLFCCTFRAR